MHIVFLTQEYPKSNNPHGGVGTFVRYLGKWLVHNNHKVSVIGINNLELYEEECDDGVRIYRLPKKKIIGLTWFYNSRLILNKIKELNKVSHVHVVEGSELSFAFLPRINGIKYLIRLHGGHHFFAQSENRGIEFWKGFQEKRSFKQSDLVVGVSQYSMSHTLNYIGFKEKAYGVINIPIDLKIFRSSFPEKQIDGRILFVGTVCEKKGIRQLIEAMILVKQVISEAHLVIVGRDWYFPSTGRSYTEFLKSFISIEMQSYIEFIGSVPNNDIPSLIEKSQICCYPSHMETFGIVAIEAMAMGKPVIFTNLGPGPEIIRDGQTGKLCDPFNPTDIAENIIYLLRNKEKATEMGFKAKLDVQQNYSLEVIGKRNLDLYKKLI